MLLRESFNKFIAYNNSKDSAPQRPKRLLKPALCVFSAIWGGRINDSKFDGKIIIYHLRIERRRAKKESR